MAFGGVYTKPVASPGQHRNEYLSSVGGVGWVVSAPLGPSRKLRGQQR
jgi:hypothetical protein